jgi:hypothetical protein
MAKCAICNGETSKENMIDIKDCICRVCDECQDNIKKYGLATAEKIAADKQEIAKVVGK